MASQEGQRGGCLPAERDALDRPQFCVPVPELAKALGLKPGDPAEVAKAIYGLLRGPNLWVFGAVFTHLREHGWIQCYTDPCMWRLFDQDDQLVGETIVHIDDFLLGGDESSSTFRKAEKALLDAWEWSPWETGSFRSTGIDLRQLDSGEIRLDQDDYLNHIDPIEISAARRREKNAKTTDREKSALRALLGALLWPANLTMPKLSAAISQLQNKIPTSTVETLQEANKWLAKARADEHTTLIIHAFEQNEPLVMLEWTDASWANRVDLASTGGKISGLAPITIKDGKTVPVALFYWQCEKLKRKCRSSLAAEVQEMANAEQDLYFNRLMWADVGLGRRLDLSEPTTDVLQVPAFILIDAKSIYDSMHGASGPLEMSEKRT